MLFCAQLSRFTTFLTLLLRLHLSKRFRLKPLVMFYLLTHLYHASFLEEPPSGLTRCERRVLKLLADGLNNSEIARTLSISVNTVQTHLQHIYQKLKVRDRAQAILWYVKNVRNKG